MHALTTTRSSMNIPNEHPSLVFRRLYFGSNKHPVPVLPNSIALSVSMIFPLALMIMLYIHKTYQGIVMLLFYVNMIITSHDSTSIELKQFWSEKFEMKDQGSLAYIS